MTSRRTLGPLHVTRDRGEPTRLLGAIFAADLGWVDGSALCSQVDPEAWWSEGPGQPAEGKALCGGCALLEPCLAYALDRPELGGVWGGTTPRERKQLRKKRRAA